MKVNVDRFEGDMAVLLVRDDESIRFNIPIALLPKDVREGDILDIAITIDVEATDDSKARISNTMERLKMKGQKGSTIIQNHKD